MKKWKIGLINIAFRILDKRVIKRIKNAEIREYVESQVKKLKQIVGLLTDKDPDNQKQLSAWWQDQRKQVFKETIESAGYMILSELENKEDAKMYAELLEDLLDEFINEEEIPVIE